MTENLLKKALNIPETFSSESALKITYFLEAMQSREIRGKFVENNHSLCLHLYKIRVLQGLSFLCLLDSPFQKLFQTSPGGFFTEKFSRVNRSPLYLFPLPTCSSTTELPTVATCTSKVPLDRRLRKKLPRELSSSKNRHQSFTSSYGFSLLSTA